MLTGRSFYTGYPIRPYPILTAPAGHCIIRKSHICAGFSVKRSNPSCFSCCCWHKRNLPLSRRAQADLCGFYVSSLLTSQLCWGCLAPPFSQRTMERELVDGHWQDCATHYQRIETAAADFLQQKPEAGLTGPKWRSGGACVL